ncbi:MAG TPA: hypothetical protein VFV38_12105 [Ktedonobacteraceae bacterium]|nr:hypothetical protein [Ktedonobacteraceae bacterium]
MLNTPACYNLDACHPHPVRLPSGLALTLTLTSHTANVLSGLGRQAPSGLVIPPTNLPV